MFTEAFPILSTRDLPRLCEFYQGLLGFTETYRFPADGEPEYLGLRLGADSQLGIGAAADTPTGPEQRLELCVYADDCDAAVAHLRAHGIKITSEPADMPWGERLAKLLHDSLKNLEQGAGGPIMQELARDVLAGRADLREVAKTSAYAGAFEESLSRFQQWQAEVGPEEVNRLAEEAEQRAAAGTVTFKTVIGPVVGYGVAAWQISRIVDAALKLNTVYDVAFSVIDIASGNLVAKLNQPDGDDLANLPLPDAEYDHPAI